MVVERLFTSNSKKNATKNNNNNTDLDENSCKIGCGNNNVPKSTKE